MFLEADSYDWDQDEALKDFLSNTLIFKALQWQDSQKQVFFKTKCNRKVSRCIWIDPYYIIYSVP